jgi:hypothetical protein
VCPVHCGQFGKKYMIKLKPKPNTIIPFLVGILKILAFLKLAMSDPRLKKLKIQTGNILFTYLGFTTHRLQSKMH